MLVDLIKLLALGISAVLFIAIVVLLVLSAINSSFLILGEAAILTILIAIAGIVLFYHTS